MKRVICCFLYLFVFTLPWEDMFVVSSLGAISKISGFLFFIMSFVYIVNRGYIYKVNGYTILISLFVLWATFSFFWSQNQTNSNILIFTVIQLFFMFLLMSQIVNEEILLLRVFQSFVLGGWVSSIGVIYNFLLNSNTFNGRFSAGSFDPNELGIILVLSITMAWYLNLKLKKRFWTLINYFYIFLGTFAVALTASRTAFLALIVCYSYILFLGNKNKVSNKFSILLKVISVSLIIYNIYTIIPDSATERLLTTSSDIKTGNFNSRQNAWEGGMQIFRDHPILGVGIGAFRTTANIKYGIDMVAHNIYVSVLGETGMIGLVLLLSILLILVRGVMRLNYSDKKFLLTMLMIWFLASLTLSWEYSKMTWLILTFVNIYYKLFNDKTKSIYSL
ncbi:hypothetical protein CEQ83_05695 [Priestia megaterium]|uniref:O-antigen ligase family protein n=1 Tax=Priestia megaterium TaxID=1404 RepID=UPI0012A8361F|nr:O-antigen ligase family protein [Priestia megaterium]QFY72025.1 hypothetical protein CEQ83_05695 [Priestia megaterium]